MRKASGNNNDFSSNVEGKCNLPAERGGRWRRSGRRATMKGDELQLLVHVRVNCCKSPIRAARNNYPAFFPRRKFKLASRSYRIIPLAKY